MCGDRGLVTNGQRADVPCGVSVEVGVTPESSQADLPQVYGALHVMATEFMRLCEEVCAHGPHTGLIKRFGRPGDESQALTVGLIMSYGDFGWMPAELGQETDVAGAEASSE